MFWEDISRLARRVSSVGRGAIMVDDKPPLYHYQVDDLSIFIYILYIIILYLILNLVGLSLIPLHIPYQLLSGGSPCSHDAAVSGAAVPWRLRQ